MSTISITQPNEWPWERNVFLAEHPRDLTPTIDGQLPQGYILHIIRDTHGDEQHLNSQLQGKFVQYIIFTIRYTNGGHPFLASEARLSNRPIYSLIEMAR